MNVLKQACLCILAIWCISDAKNTFTSFTLAPAVPLTSTEAQVSRAAQVEVEQGIVRYKKLGTGWDAAWTFFGKPFVDRDGLLSGLAFGGKISYSRWVRDSTWNPVSFLGTQGIARLYIPSIVAPLNLFGQMGGGVYIGEYGFTSPDSIDWSTTPFNSNERQILEGKIVPAVHFGIGVDLDVVELMPVINIAATKGSMSAWFSLNAGIVF